MSSHVPFLAVRPNEQFSTSVIETSAVSVSSPADKSASFLERIPSAVRFPLVVISSLGLSAASYTLVANYAGFELAATARDATDNLNVAYFLGWRIIGIAFGWFAGYDYQDMISLTCLVNLPYYYLLTTFYNIDNFAGVAALLVDIFSFAAPFALFRSKTHAHADPATKDADQLVAQDRTVYGVVSLFGSAIYAFIVHSSFYTWLPTYMIVHFDGLRSLEKAHSAGLPLLVSILIPIGLASTHFLFGSAVGAKNSRADIGTPEKAKFDPENATFAETVAWNLGFGANGWTKRTEVLAKRTLILAGATFTNTFVRVLSTIEGSEAVGAFGWAGVWTSAALLTGIAYGWVGDE